jgi:uncharacterized membrane protein YczE
VRGGLAARLASLVLGLFLFAAGIVAFLQADLGLSPWDVLHQGISLRMSVSFGLANIAVGVVVLALAVLLGARIGIGTVANAILVGLFVDALNALDLVQRLGEAPLAGRVALLGIGVAMTGAGSALYIGAALGAGPRDSLMLVSSRRTGVRVGVVRTVIELTALVLGWLLGGSVGVGTAVYALLVGPSIELSFGLLRRSPLARRPGGTPLPAPAAADLEA